MLFRWIGSLLMVAGLLSLLAQWTLIPLAEQALTRAAARWPAAEVEVRVDAFPAWELLQGKMDKLNIKAKHVRLNDLTLAELQGEFHQVQFSWWAAWHHGDFSYSFQEPGDIRVTVTEENLNQYLSGRLDLPLQNLSVSIAGSRLQLTSFLTVAGQKLPLWLTGTLVLEEPGRIKVIPERIQVGSLIPGWGLQERLTGDIVFQLPLEGLPVKLEFHRLEGGLGQFTLHGSVWIK